MQVLLCTVATVNIIDHSIRQGKPVRVPWWQWKRSPGSESDDRAVFRCDLQAPLSDSLLPFLHYKLERAQSIVLVVLSRNEIVL